MQRIKEAFLYSVDGLRAAWKDEAAFRIEAKLAAFMIPLACFIAPSRAALGVMVATVLLVLLVELMNTAIEAAIDLHDKQHPLAKKAKDCGSAAVLVALVACGFSWAVIVFGR